MVFAFQYFNGSSWVTIPNAVLSQIIDELNGQLELDFIIPNTSSNLTFVQSNQQVQLLWGSTVIFSGLLMAYTATFTQITCTVYNNTFEVMQKRQVTGAYNNVAANTVLAAICAASGMTAGSCPTTAVSIQFNSTDCYTAVQNLAALLNQNVYNTGSTVIIGVKGNQTPTAITIDTQSSVNFDRSKTNYQGVIIRGVSPTGQVIIGTAGSTGSGNNTITLTNNAVTSQASLNALAAAYLESLAETNSGCPLEADISQTATLNSGDLVTISNGADLGLSGNYAIYRITKNLTKSTLEIVTPAGAFLALINATSSINGVIASLANSTTALQTLPSGSDPNTSGMYVTLTDNYGDVASLMLGNNLLLPVPSSGFPASFLTFNSSYLTYIIPSVANQNGSPATATITPQSGSPYTAPMIGLGTYKYPFLWVDQVFCFTDYINSLESSVISLLAPLKFYTGSAGVKLYDATNSSGNNGQVLEVVSGLPVWTNLTATLSQLPTGTSGYFLEGQGSSTAPTYAQVTFSLLGGSISTAQLSTSVTPATLSGSGAIPSTWTVPWSDLSGVSSASPTFAGLTVSGAAVFQQTGANAFQVYGKSYFDDTMYVASEIVFNASSKYAYVVWANNYVLTLGGDSGSPFHAIINSITMYFGALDAGALFTNYVNCLDDNGKLYLNGVLTLDSALHLYYGSAGAKLYDSVNSAPSSSSGTTYYLQTSSSGYPVWVSYNPAAWNGGGISDGNYINDSSYSQTFIGFNNKSSWSSSISITAGQLIIGNQNSNMLFGNWVSHGFYFYNNVSGTPLQLAYIDSSGNLTINGNFSANSTHWQNVGSGDSPSFAGCTFNSSSNPLYINISASTSGAEADFRILTSGYEAFFGLVGTAGQISSVSALGDLVIRSDNGRILFITNGQYTTYQMLLDKIGNLTVNGGNVTFSGTTTSFLNVESSGSGSEIHIFFRNSASNLDGYVGLAGTAGQLDTFSSSGDLVLRQDNGSHIIFSNGGSKLGYFDNSGDLTISGGLTAESKSGIVATDTGWGQLQLINSTVNSVSISFVAGGTGLSTNLPSTLVAGGYLWNMGVNPSGLGVNYFGIYAFSQASNSGTLVFKSDASGDLTLAGNFTANGTGTSEFYGALTVAGAVIFQYNNSGSPTLTDLQVYGGATFDYDVALAAELIFNPNSGYGAYLEWINNDVLVLGISDSTYSSSLGSFTDRHGNTVYYGALNLGAIYTNYLQPLIGANGILFGATLHQAATGVGYASYYGGGGGGTGSNGICLDGYGNVCFTGTSSSATWNVVTSVGGTSLFAVGYNGNYITTGPTTLQPSGGSAFNGNLGDGSASDGHSWGAVWANYIYHHSGYTNSFDELDDLSFVRNYKVTKVMREHPITHVKIESNNIDVPNSFPFLTDKNGFVHVGDSFGYTMGCLKQVAFKLDSHDEIIKALKDEINSLRSQIYKLTAKHVL